MHVHINIKYLLASPKAYETLKIKLFIIHIKYHIEQYSKYNKIIFGGTFQYHIQYILKYNQMLLYIKSLLLK